jgi:hypothetical protein
MPVAGGLASLLCATVVQSAPKNIWGGHRFPGFQFTHEPVEYIEQNRENVSFVSVDESEADYIIIGGGPGEKYCCYVYRWPNLP